MFSIETFRQPGDAANDYFPAYQRLVAAVNAAGGGDVLFPPGVYYMDAFQQYSAPPGTQVGPAFNGCTNLRVSGYGAKIDLRGNFHRSSGDDKHPITGLYFFNCSHFEVEGFEIDGNLDQMTRDANMTEITWSYGILTAGCTHYTLRDLDIHHHLVDGLRMGPLPGALANDSNVVLENVRSQYNGRQGMTLNGVRELTALNCEFSYSGHTLPYGAHGPAEGLHIQPVIDATVTDAMVEDLLFINCRFHDNLGGGIAAAYPETTRRVTFRDCRVTYPASRGWEGVEQAVILYVEEGVMDNCYMDLGPRNAYLTYGAASAKARNSMLNCTVRSSRNGVAALHDAAALVQGCRIICTATAPTSEFPWSWNPKMRFIDNYVFRPKESFVAQAGLAMRAAFLTGAEYRDNRWDTNLVPTAPLTAANGEYFGNEYSSPVIRDERYLTPQYRYYWSDVTPSTTGVPFSVYNASGAADNVADAPALTAPSSFSSTYTGSEVAALRSDVAALRATLNALLAARREVYEQV